MINAQVVRKMQLDISKYTAVALGDNENIGGRQKHTSLLNLQIPAEIGIINEEA